MSIQKIIQENNKVLNIRNWIQIIVGNEVSVTIGGSYALKYQLDCFENRTVKDYDFIIRGPEESIKKVNNLFRVLDHLKLFKKNGSIESSHYFYCDEMEIDIITEIGDIRHSLYENPIDIINAKKRYVIDAYKNNRPARQKDIDDIELYEKNY